MIRTNKKEGKKFLRLLITAYEKGLLGPHLHEKFRLPANARANEEKAEYLFYSINLDYGVRAEKLFKKMRKLYSENKELFTPEALAKKNEKELILLMKKLEMRFPVQAAKRWKKNSQKLLEEYNGSVLRVFKGSTGEILARLKAFHGFGDKLSRLLLRVMVERRVIRKPRGFEKMSIPTDVHDVRLAFRSGLLTGEKPEYSKHVKKARQAWTEISLEEGIIPAETDRALWVLGAEWCYKKRCKECPVREECRDKIIK